MVGRRLDRHQASHAFAVPRDQHLFTSFYFLEQPGEMGLGFKGADTFQGKFNQSQTSLSLAHEKAPVAGG